MKTYIFLALGKAKTEQPASKLLFLAFETASCNYFCFGNVENKLNVHFLSILFLFFYVVEKNYM